MVYDKIYCKKYLTIGLTSIIPFNMDKMIQSKQGTVKTVTLSAKVAVKGTL